MPGRLRRIPRESLVLGRYLAEGSFGEVHVAQLQGADIDVVVKTVIQPSDEVRGLPRPAPDAHITRLA